MNGTWIVVLVWLGMLFAWLVIALISFRLDWQRRMRDKAREEYFMKDQRK